MARVIAVASAKGGVGKTTTTATLGTTLAATGARVVAVDADLGMANLGSALGVDADEATVHDVLAGRADVDEAMYDGPGGLTVVPGDTALAAFPDADPSKLRTLLGEFIDFDYVLLDTGAGLSHDTVLPLGLADDVLLVTNPDPTAVGDTEKTRQVVERLDGSVAGAVVTRVDPDRLANGDPTLVSGLDAPVLAAVPSSPLVTEATTTGEPVSLSAPTSDVAAAYRELTRELTDETVSEPESPDDEETDSDEDGSLAVDVDDDDEEGEEEEAATSAESESADADAESAESADEEDTEAVEADESDEETVDAAEEEAEAESDEETVEATEGEADAESDEETVEAVEEKAEGESDEVAEEEAEAESDEEAVEAVEDEAEDELDEETVEVADDETEDEPDEETVEVAEEETEDESDEETVEATEDEGEDERDEDADLAEDDTDSEDDVLVHDAENGEPVEDVDLSDSDEDADGGVYETSLVEEAEASGISVETDDETNDDDDDESGSGFLGRLLG